MRFEQISELSVETLAQFLTDYPEAAESMVLTFNQLIQNVNRLSTTISLEDNVDCEVRTFEFSQTAGDDTVVLGLRSNQNPRQIVVGRVFALDGSAINNAVQITEWEVNTFKQLSIKNVSGLTPSVRYNITATIYF